MNLGLPGFIFGFTKDSSVQRLEKNSRKTVPSKVKLKVNYLQVYLNCSKHQQAGLRFSVQLVELLLLL